MDTAEEIRALREDVAEMKQMLSAFVCPPERKQPQEGMGAYELSRIVSSDDPLAAIRERNKRVKARRK